MISATKAAHAPELSLSTDTWLGRLWRAISKTSDQHVSLGFDATQDINFPTEQPSLTQGYLQTLNALHETFGEDPCGYGYGAFPVDGTTEESDPVAAIIQESLSGLASDPAFRFCDHIYTIRCSDGDKPSGLVVTKTRSETAK